MHICNMHIDVLFALEQSSWQLVFGLTALVCFTIDGRDLKAAPFATLQSQVPIIIIYGTLRTCLSANPLPSRKKHKTARPHLNTHLTNQQGIFLDIFLIHYSKELFGRGHEAYECLEYL